uniref:Large ribosomal subunit protein mL49 n=1 Tax=Syphacia muris TaxID=451379 RepID=A0A0N5A9S0_9BILA
MLCLKRCLVLPISSGKPLKSVVNLLSTSTSSNDEPIWKDPFKIAMKKAETRTDFEEVDVNWDYIERLLPLEVIPEVPKHESYPTPSGWCPPRSDVNLPYHVSRRRDHLFPLYVSSRRDVLDEKTMDFTYVQVVKLRKISGDVFACAKDAQQFIEKEIKHPVGMNVDELKGMVTFKDVEKSLLEKFLYSCGF